MIAVIALSGSGLLNAVLWLIIAGLVFWLVNWLIDYCGLPQPFNKVAKVIVAVVAVILLINALLSIAGRPFITF